MNNEDEIANLKAELTEIQKRNKRVEADKAWEKSFTRTLCIAVITYIIAALVLVLINSGHPLRNALIPTVGFYLSTLSLPIIKRRWIKRHKIMNTEGIFKNYALKGKPIEEVIALEKNALGNAFADNYKKKTEKHKL